MNEPLHLPSVAFMAGLFTAQVGAVMAFAEFMRGRDKTAPPAEDTKCLRGR